MKIGSIRGRLRNQNGMGSVELAVTAFVGVMFCCLAVDLGVMMLGNQMLDRATRDAARAAAAQPDRNKAIAAANAALAGHKADGNLVQTPQLKTSEFIYFDNNGTPDGQEIPPGYSNAGKTAGIDTEPAHVSVTATSEVLLPANLSMFGGLLSLQQGALATGKMQFRRTYYFPIVKTKLNNAFQ